MTLPDRLTRLQRHLQTAVQSPFRGAIITRRSATVPIRMRSSNFFPADAVMAESSFDWADPLGLERELSEDERMVRDSARRFCQSQLAPRVRDDFRDERFDRALMEAMGEMGFLGATLPESEGGAGLSN